MKLIEITMNLNGCISRDISPGISLLVSRTGSVISEKYMNIWYLPITFGVTLITDAMETKKKKHI